MVQYADWNLVPFPDRDVALAKIRDLTCLTDILTTGYHGCVTAGVTTGSTVLVAGPGPVGLAAAAAAFLLGAEVVTVTGHNAARLAHARSFGCETIDLTRDGSINDQIEQILGVPEVDCAIDCVGFEAKGHGGGDEPAIVLNQLMEATRAAGAIGIPGLYVTEDPGAKDESARHGYLSLRLGLGWAKAHSFPTGPTPLMKYNPELLMALPNQPLPHPKA